MFDNDNDRNHMEQTNKQYIITTMMHNDTDSAIDEYNCITQTMDELALELVDIREYLEELWNFNFGGEHAWYLTEDDIPALRILYNFTQVADLVGEKVKLTFNVTEKLLDEQLIEIINEFGADSGIYVDYDESEEGIGSAIIALE